MRRAWLLVVVAMIVLGGCGGRGNQGPAWPKMAEPEVDGGESLAPRHPSVIASSKEKEKKVEVKPDAAAAAEPSAEAAAEDADAADDAAASTDGGDEETVDLEDAITAEEIVIEIEEDDE